MLAIVAAVIIATAGIAVDYAKWIKQESRLQGVSDAAALAGSLEYVLESNKKKDQSKAEARAKIAVDGYISAHAASLNSTPVVSFTQDPATITVDLSQDGTRTLSSLLPGMDANIRVSSTAVIGQKTDAPCVIGLSEIASPAVRFSGSGPMSAENCAVWSNSTQSLAMEGSGSGSASASSFCAVGGVTQGSTVFSTPPQSGCPEVEDPFADLEMPAIGLCTATNLSISDSGVVPLAPGVYCGGVKFTSQATIQLAPGNYIIKDGPFTMVGGSSIEGDGVTFFLTGPGSGLKLGGAASINLKAPTSGEYAGIAIFSDRNSGPEISSLRGSSSLDIEGTIYLPNHDLTYSGNNSAILPAAFTVLIASTVEFTGSSEVSIRSDFAASDIPVPEVILQGRIAPRLLR